MAVKRYVQGAGQVYGVPKQWISVRALQMIHERTSSSRMPAQDVQLDDHKRKKCTSGFTRLKSHVLITYCRQLHSFTKPLVAVHPVWGGGTPACPYMRKDTSWTPCDLLASQTAGFRLAYLFLFRFRSAYRCVPVERIKNSRFNSLSRISEVVWFEITIWCLATVTFVRIFLRILLNCPVLKLQRTILFVFLVRDLNCNCHNMFNGQQ